MANQLQARSYQNTCGRPAAIRRQPGIPYWALEKQAPGGKPPRENPRKKVWKNL